jgi:hypothetical protein
MKPKLAAAVADVHHAEASLADEYRKVGERHAADHDVFHICHRLAAQCETHVQRLTELAASEGDRLPDDGHESLVHDIVATARRKMSEVAGRSAAPGQLLLDDLRHLFVMVSDCEAAWTIVGQGAKASRHAPLIALYGSCCEEIVGQLRWVKTKLKLAAPQVLAVG